MPTSDAIRRLAVRTLKLFVPLAFVPPLLTRVLVGWAFVLTGTGKWSRIDGVVDYFTQLGIPFPSANAHFVATLELVGGACLIVGLASRLMALGLSSTMVVALLTAERETVASALTAWPPGDLTDTAAAVCLVFLLWIVIYGPGVVSLDTLLARWLRLPKRS